MRSDSHVTVRMLAYLHFLRSQEGLPSTLRVDVPTEGVRADELAAELGLPLEAVEGVFLNHTKAGLDAVIRPGDRVAFVPYGTPASHPAFFGSFMDRARTLSS